jgi:Tfp pilus assembly protein PilO
MKAVFNVATQVPLSRVLREYRRALLPLGVVLAVNLIVLVAVVLPLSQRVASSEGRAQAAERAQVAADVDFKQAEALRDSTARATADLETFYKQVLPANSAAARRITHLKPQQVAREHDVRYERGATTEDDVAKSLLERYTVSMTLSGDYEDIRSFIYALETSPDFIVIDNVVLGEGNTANAPLSLSLQLTTFYRSSSDARMTRSNGR